MDRLSFITWRRFHGLLCLIALAVALVRLATGHLFGAVVPLVMAAIFASIATRYPLWTRLKQLAGLARRAAKRRKP